MAADCPLYYLSPLLPYPRSLPRPCACVTTTQLVCESFRSFPQFGNVAEERKRYSFFNLQRRLPQASQSHVLFFYLWVANLSFIIRLGISTVAHGVYCSPLTTTHRIKKELSICQSLLCLDLVSFPVLSQITYTTDRFIHSEHFLSKLSLIFIFKISHDPKQPLWKPHSSC